MLLLVVATWLIMLSI